VLPRKTIDRAAERSSRFAVSQRETRRAQEPYCMVGVAEARVAATEVAPLLEVRGLSKSFRGLEALAD
jgi:hypothetical protein